MEHNNWKLVWAISEEKMRKEVREYRKRIVFNVRHLPQFLEIVSWIDLSESNLNHCPCFQLLPTFSSFIDFRECLYKEPIRNLSYKENENVFHFFIILIAHSEWLQCRCERENHYKFIIHFLWCEIGCVLAPSLYA